MKQFVKSLRKSKRLAILWTAFALIFTKVLIWLVGFEEIQLRDFIILPLSAVIFGLIFWSFANYVND